MQAMTAIGNNIAFALLGMVSVVVIILLLLAWRNPVLFRMGLRNIPRRPGQSALIVVGLTLSTIIIVASFATGDTLNYSVQRQAVAAYGTIDEILAPPLISLLASMGGGGNVSTDQQSEATEQLSNLFAGGLTSVLTFLQGGLPGIPTERLDQLKTEAAADPQIDAVAGSILFPTIIRNVNTGQGEPIGVIFAVDNDYDESFGITRVDGQRLQVESLAPGVGTIFQGVANGLGAAGSAVQGLGFNLSANNLVALAGGVVALASGASSGDLSALGSIPLDIAALEQLGVDTQPLTDRGIEEVTIADLLAIVPGLRDFLASSLGISGTLGVTDTVTVDALQSLLSIPSLLGSVGLTMTAPLSATVPPVNTVPPTNTVPPVNTEPLSATALLTIPVASATTPSATAPLVALPTSPLTGTSALTSATTAITGVPAATATPATSGEANGTGEGPRGPARMFEDSTRFNTAPEVVVPNEGLIAGAALTETAAVTATNTATGVAGFMDNIVQQSTDLVSSINLNTVGRDLDNQLGRVGLQLKQGDVFLNRIGAEQLGAQTGDLLEIFIGPVPVRYRVRAVIEEASPLGALLPVVMMRLDEAQQLLFMQGKVNNVLVSNTGDMLEGVQYTAEVSSRLRALAMEPDVLANIADILREPAVLRAVEAESARSMMGRGPGEEMPVWIRNIVVSFAPDAFAVQEQLAALPAALAEPGVSDALRTVLANTEVRSRLLGLNIPAESQAALADEFSRVNQFDVIDFLNKQTVLTAANAGGTIFSSLFSIFGFFSILAGIILIFLIFVMLAAERRSEMGIARAIGVQRRHLIQMFVSEGMVYSLLSAAVGLLLGLAISFVLINYLGNIVNSVAGQVVQTSAGILDFQFRVSWRSVVISYTLGVLFTFFVILISSWRVSRLNIVAAIRDMPDETNLKRMSVVGRIGRWLWPLLLLALGIWIGYYGFFVWTLWSLVLVGATVALFGLMNLVGHLLDMTRLRPESVQRIVYTIIGLGLLALWISPWQRLLPTLGLERFTGDPTQILAVFGIGAPMIITGAIMAIMFNATFFTWIIERLFGWIGSLTPVLKTAIAYPLNSRFRTGTAMVLFAMIMTTVVVMSMVIQVTQSTTTMSTAESGGFEIKASNTLLSFFSPLGDMEPTIARALPDYPLLAQVEHVGSVATQDVEVRMPGGSQQYIEMLGMSGGFITQVGPIYPLMQRAEGYADDAAVWEALRTRDDVVIVTEHLVDESGGAGGPVPTPTPEVFMGVVVNEEEMQNPEMAYGRNFRIGGISLNQSFAPVPVELLYNDSGTTRVKTVNVIGVLPSETMLRDQAMQGNIRILDSLTGAAVSRSDHFLTVKPGADVHEVAAEVERAFLGNGINATVMADGFAQTQALTRNILRLLQGFMALGLLVGIAGLGVITTRTVVERRQQVGMLRALGYQARMVALSFVLEASFIAIMGILIGAATGIVLGLNIIGVAFGTVADFQMPWLSISLTVLLAYGFALLTTIIPAWQASRIYPAEALRYE